MTGIIIGIIVLLLLLWGVSIYNSFVTAEQTIKARYKSSQASLTNAVNTLKTMGITSQTYIDAFTNALQKAIEGRWGPGGSKMVIGAITESNPVLPTDVLTKMQTVTEEVYADFYAAQVATVDADAMYIASTQRFPNSLIANAFKFPSFDYTQADYGKVIMTAESAAAFQTGTMKPIDPFQ